MAEYTFEWRGEQVQADVFEAVSDALKRASEDAVEFLRAHTPVDTGFLRSTSFVRSDPRGNLNLDGPGMKIGQTASYASYVELGTRFMPGHFQITQTALYIFPVLPDFIGKAIGQKGYGTVSEGGSIGGPGLPNPFRHIGV